MQKDAKKNAINSNAENDKLEPLTSNVPNSPSESEFQTLWESENSPNQMILEFCSSHYTTTHLTGTLRLTEG